MDVVIIGGGFAGLSAAQKLQKNGYSCVLLEAKNRVGGRVQTDLIDGKAFDMGGTWINPIAHESITELAKEVGVEIVEQFESGKKIWQSTKGLKIYNSALPNLSPLSLLDLHFSVQKLEKIAFKLTNESFLQSQEAISYDQQTFENWLNQNVWTEETRELYRTAFRVILGIDPKEANLLFLFAYVRASEGIEPLFGVKGGNQDSRFLTGSQSLAEAIVKKLLKPGTVHLSSPVSMVKKLNNGKFEVISSKGQSWKCDHVIVCVPYHMISKITFEPPLPPLYDQLIQRIPMGYTMKVIAVYKKPFWREKGFSGEVVSSQEPVILVYDTSPPSCAYGSLTCFLAGDEGRYWGSVPADQRKKAVMDQLVNWFGKEANDIQHYLEKDWNDDEWAKGCPVGSMACGAMTTTIGQVYRKPIGNIHFATTETALKYTGFMEGAVQSGLAAAQAIIDHKKAPANFQVIHPTDPRKANNFTNWILLLSIFVAIVSLFLFLISNKVN